MFQDVNNAGIDFEIYGGNVKENIPGYQDVSCYIIFYVNPGEHFHCKYSIISVGHKSKTSSSHHYFPAVSWDIIRIALNFLNWMVLRFFHDKYRMRTLLKSYKRRYGLWQEHILVPIK